MERGGDAKGGKKQGNKLNFTGRIPLLVVVGVAHDPLLVTYGALVCCAAAVAANGLGTSLRSQGREPCSRARQEHAFGKEDGHFFADTQTR